jgi:hypothetical protein
MRFCNNTAVASDGAVYYPVKTSSPPRVHDRVMSLATTALQYSLPGPPAATVSIYGSRRIKAGLPELTDPGGA